MQRVGAFRLLLPFLVAFKKLMEGGVQITKCCLVGDKYHSEVALKIETVKDRGVRGGFGTPGIPPDYAPGHVVFKTIHFKSDFFLCVYI